MKQSSEYILIIYFVIMLLVMLTFAKCHAAESFIRITDERTHVGVVVRCPNGIFYAKRVRKPVKDTDLAKWASEQCSKGELK